MGRARAGARQAQGALEGARIKVVDTASKQRAHGLRLLIRGNGGAGTRPGGKFDGSCGSGYRLGGRDGSWARFVVRAVGRTRDDKNEGDNSLYDCLVIPCASPAFRRRREVVFYTTNETRGTGYATEAKRGLRPKRDKGTYGNE